MGAAGSGPGLLSPACRQALRCAASLFRMKGSGPGSGGGPWYMAGVAHMLVHARKAADAVSHFHGCCKCGWQRAATQGCAAARTGGSAGEAAVPDNGCAGLQPVREAGPSTTVQGASMRGRRVPLQCWLGGAQVPGHRLFGPRCGGVGKGLCVHLNHSNPCMDPLIRAMSCRVRVSIPKARPHVKLPMQGS